VGALLGDLERYIHAEGDLAPLLRIALVHVQFESIHPYLDGNGRLGRMLVALLLDHWRLLKSPMLYLSLYLKRNQAAYYRWLGAIRTEGDWVGWLRFFLIGVAEIAEDAARTASALYARVSEDRKTLLATPGATITAMQLFEQLPEHPVVTMPLVTRLVSTSKPTGGEGDRRVDQGRDSCREWATASVTGCTATMAICGCLIRDPERDRPGPEGCHVKRSYVMARVAIIRPEQVEDPVIREIFSWVTRVEGAVPNHFYVEMNFPEFLKAKLGATRVLWEQGNSRCRRSSTSASWFRGPTVVPTARLRSARS
jgi:hypothetical protein